MTIQRLRELLKAFGEVRLAVVGDFFLDKYLEIDPALHEVSLETGKTAYQVVGFRCSPGAAGTVTNNLAALGVGTIYAVGFVGADGQAYELKEGLAKTGVRLDHLFECDDLMTPTYTKPLVRHEDGTLEELNRLDIKNRKPLPAEVEDAIIEQLHICVQQVDGVIIADQVQERNCGVITDHIREVLADLAAEYEEKVFFVDSRTRISEFTNVIIKPNQYEAVVGQASRLLPPPVGQASRLPTIVEVEQAAAKLSQRTGKPVYVTMGERGVLVCDGQGCEVIPAPKVIGPIDIVGAGDSVTAGIGASLCAGASLTEAAVVGNLVASITIQQIGTTGTATPQQVLAHLKEVRSS